MARRSRPRARVSYDQSDAMGDIAASPECSVYSTPRSDASDIGERQRTRTLAVDVRESVLLRDGRGDQHFSGMPQHIRIARERGDGASDELRRLRIAQVEELRGFHDLFRSNEPRVERDDGDAMRLRLG